jgi:hypothetical protein
MFPDTPPLPVKVPKPPEPPKIHFQPEDNPSIEFKIDDVLAQVAKIQSAAPDKLQK